MYKQFLLAFFPFLVIFLIIFGAIKYPEVTIIGLLLFNMFWVTKLIIQNYEIYNTSKLINYFKNINLYDEILNSNSLKILDEKPVPNSFYSKYINSHINASIYFKLSKIEHLIVIPEYKENSKILADTLECIKGQQFPSDKIHICIAQEDRDSEKDETFNELQRKYGNCFKSFFRTNHIKTEHEIIGKDSNLHSANKEIQKRFSNEEKDNIMVTVLDADNRIVNQNYLGQLAFMASIEEDNTYTMYKGINFFYGNYKDIPFYERVVASQLSMWSCGNSIYSYVAPISSYSYILSKLDNIAWDGRTISDEQELFFNGVNKYPDKFKILPIFLPLYLSMPSQSFYFLNNFIPLYKQFLRQLYGAVVLDTKLIEDILKNSNIGIYRKIAYIYYMLDTHIMWPVTIVALSFGVDMFYLFDKSFVSSGIGLTIINLQNIILIFAVILYGITILFDIRFRFEYRESHFKPSREIFLAFGWIYMPVIQFFIAFVPYVEIAIRILINKPLQHIPSEKR